MLIPQRLVSEVLDRRRSGVLLHPTSLPGGGHNGTLGSHAYRFVDFLLEGGFTVWQTLPLGPVDEHGSPYCQSSAYAGDVRLIDAEAMARSRALPRTMLFSAAREDPIVAYQSFRDTAEEPHNAEFARFIRAHRHWVFPFSMFELCRAKFGNRPWWQWPEPYRSRSWDALVELTNDHLLQFRATVFQQYLVEQQWSDLKSYANKNGVFMFGDLPFYMDRNSVDVWWNRRLFKLDAKGEPLAVAGVPPDYFNEDGQLWGNPLYDWEQMRKEGFDWWRARLRFQLSRFDLLRIDHFRALESYWEVPVGAKSAREGSWQRGYGHDLLKVLASRFENLALVAEDLGMVDDAVYALRDEFDLPGMAVVQFAFDGLAHNPHLPKNHRENSVVYTGTHDNDTLIGWYSGLDEATRQRIIDELDADGHDMPEFIIDVVYQSRARLAVLPMQDLLGFGSEARMNTPGKAEGNWKWRFDWESVDPSVAAKAKKRAAASDRLPR